MALKAQWVVTAEIIPGRPVEELTKCWQYTSRHRTMDVDIEGGTIFERFKREANEYALSLQDPSQVNIVNLQFMWL